MDQLRHRGRAGRCIAALAVCAAALAPGAARGQAQPAEPEPSAVAAAIAAAAGLTPPPVPEREPIARLSRPQPTRAVILAEQRATAARRAEARRLARSRTVPGALRRALLLRAIDREQHDAYRRTWWRAGVAQARLGGQRGRELGAVLDQVRSLAQRRMLGPRRIAAAMLSVRRNAEVWTSRPFPKPGADVSFPRDDRVYRYIPGQGVQLHPLASFGVANALARACISVSKPCRRKRLRRLLDDLIAVSSFRAGYRAWEYGYRFGTGVPPWVSGMAQGTAVQAYARGARALGDRSYLDISRSALGAFERRPPAGVSTGTGDRRRYVMYSFSPGEHILNGELQAVAGLHDLWKLSGDGRARALFERGERGVRASVAAYDTGAWSRYSEGGPEANLHYHRFATYQLRGLCRRTKQGAYCRAKHRFRRYQKEPPTVRIGAVRGAWAGRPARIGFSLSKIGRAWIRVDGSGGRSYERTFTGLPRGRHSVMWTPPRRGTYVVRIDARGLSGPAGRAALTVRVAHPTPKPERKPKQRTKDRRGTR